MWLSKNRTVPIFLVVAILGLFSLGSLQRWLEPIELITYDLRMAIRQPGPVDPRIAIVEVADDSIEQLGQWPFPRSYHAHLIEALTQAGARVIAFDVLFAEPSTPEEDAALVTAARASGRVALPYAFRLGGVTGGRWQAQRYDAPVLPELGDAAHLTGHINVVSDRDGKTRAFPLFVEHAGRLHPALNLAIACGITGVRPEDIRVAPGRVVLGQWASIPVDGSGRMYLDFAGRWAKTFRHYSYADVLVSYARELEGGPTRLDLREFDGAICLIGVTATGLHDLNPVPLEPRYPMIGVHANLINNLLLRSWIRRAPRTVNLAILWALMLLTWVVSRRMKALEAAIATAAVLLGLWLVGCGWFAVGGYWMDLAWPSVVMVGLNFSITVQGYLAERQHRLLFERELAIAHELQQSFLPPTFPTHPAYAVAAIMKPAKTIGGDLYQCVAFNEGVIGLLIGDVSGKGVPAALLMAKVSSLVKLCAKDGMGPAAVLEALNELLVGEFHGGRFLTAVYAVVHPASRTVTVANAGHPDVVALGRNGPRLVGKASGMPLGLMAGARYADESVRLASGESVVMVTDGIVEGRDRRGQEFGWERILAVSQRVGGEEIDQVVNTLAQEVQVFATGVPQSDDLTVVGVRMT